MEHLRKQSTADTEPLAEVTRTMSGMRSAKGRLCKSVCSKKKLKNKKLLWAEFCGILFVQVFEKAKGVRMEKGRQGKALDRKKLLADPILITVIIGLFVFLLLWAFYAFGVRPHFWNGGIQEGDF